MKDDLWSFYSSACRSLFLNGKYCVNRCVQESLLSFVNLYKCSNICHCFFLPWIQVPISALISFVDSLEAGYSKHKNPYHNLMHAADVTQTIHYLLLKTGMVVSLVFDEKLKL